MYWGSRNFIEPHELSVFEEAASAPVLVCGQRAC
jgi:hypothetical protein